MLTWIFLAGFCNPLAELSVFCRITSYSVPSTIGSTQGAIKSITPKGREGGSYRDNTTRMRWLPLRTFSKDSLIWMLNMLAKYTSHLIAMILRVHCKPSCTRRAGMLRSNRFLPSQNCLALLFLVTGPQSRLFPSLIS